MKPDLHEFKAIVQPLTAKTRLAIPVYLNILKLIL
jgi:hypothetical protein